MPPGLDPQAITGRSAAASSSRLVEHMRGVSSRINPTVWTHQMVAAIMTYAKPLATETAIAVPAANPQTSVFAYASIGSLPLAASLQSKPPLARIVPLSACGEQMGPCYMPAAHIAPATAMKVTPATNIAAANRQLLCMEHLKLLDRISSGLGGSFWATS